MFLLELILGGPGQWAAVGGMSVRYWLLFGTAVSLSALATMYRPWRLRPDEVFLFFAITISLLVWVALLPLLRWTPIGWAAADGDALLLLYLYFPLAHLVRREVIAWRGAVLWLIGASMVVAVSHLVLFALGSFGGRTVGFGAAVLMGDLMNSSSIYVGYVGSFYRVMWISSLFVLFAFFLAMRDVQRPLVRRVLLLTLGGALVVTYTRGFWLGVALGVLLFQLGSLLSSFRRIGDRLELPTLRRRHLVNVAVIIGLLALAAVVTEFQVVERLLVTFDAEQDVSVAVRNTQVQRLLESWSRAPLAGTGFGSYVRGFPGAADAPFSYELTGPLLLMKTGVLGLALGLAVGALFLWRAHRAARKRGNPRWLHGWMAAALAIGIAFQTNPYLLNFVGMTILLFLMIDVVDQERDRTFVDSSSPGIRVAQ